MKVAIVGEFQTGKSTLINCLLDSHVAAVGDGLRTTKVPVTYKFGQATTVIGVTPRATFRTTLQEFLSPTRSDLWDDCREVTITQYKPLLARRIQLVDTPGVEFSDADQQAAGRAVRDAGYFILLLVKPLGTGKLGTFFQEIARFPYGIVFNCGRVSPADPTAAANQELEKEIMAWITNNRLCRPLFFRAVNLHWVYEGVIRNTPDSVPSPTTKPSRPMRLLKRAGFVGLRARLLDEFRRTHRVKRIHPSTTLPGPPAPKCPFCGQSRHGVPVIESVEGVLICARCVNWYSAFLSKDARFSRLIDQRDHLVQL